VTRAKRKVAVLISGRGSNLAALIAACDEKDFPATICLVASNRPEAAGLTHAERNGMATRVVDHTAFARNTEFEQELDAALRAAGADIVCLAGFMRLLSPGFVELWRDRMLNIHPSLLPLFPGLRTHERALAAGVKIHGATVHFVRAETDSGPIVAQGAVPVLPGDTPATLAARVLGVEHRLYPLALKLVASGAATILDDRVVIAGMPGAPAASLLSPSG
jgi:phosphoribosylglycinamide formyltransferase-1